MWPQFTLFVGSIANQCWHVNNRSDRLSFFIQGLGERSVVVVCNKVNWLLIPKVKNPPVPKECRRIFKQVDFAYCLQFSSIFVFIQVERHPKLEKADILEMTVRHIQGLQQQSYGGNSNVSQFHAGFSECLSEVSRFLSNCENIELDTRLRIMNHLADKCSTMPEPVSSERRVPSPIMQQQHEPQTSVHRHPRRSSAPRHSPYGYHRVQSSSPVPVIPSDQRVPPMHYAPSSQNNLVVVIPADSYPSTIVSPTSPKHELYPTPPQSPVEEVIKTPTLSHQYPSSTALQTVSSAPQQTRLPSQSAAMCVPVARPVQVQEPVWRPW